MRTLLISSSLCLLGIALTGCASITRGNTDQITITTDPTGARVTTSLSQACTSPCTLTVGRKDEFVVTAVADGYRPQEVPVTTKIATAGAVGFAGNILLGGVIGMGVDAATGATLEHIPNPVHIALEPVGRPAGPGIARRHRRAKAAPSA